ncbi:MAG: 50S ribosomal protein L20 [Candidatus Cloacimonadota bacterium]|nr:50S ribosomal protein L20 [Candidatus Cloacimonadota bacterium]
MARSTNNVAAKRRRKKYLKHAKGYFGAKSKLYRTARQQVEKGWQYAYRDRKVKKREFRKLWILRINAGAAKHGLKYSRLIHGLKQANIEINRKVLAHLAFEEPKAFEKLCEIAKENI